ncbi:lipoprotein signal peptidase [bacterium BMS3Abin03]|nr:lipoprotein signal peptidase [bacterium BMS3Abin03]
MKLLFISFLIFLADQFSKLYVKGFNFPLFDFSHAGLPQSRSIPLIHNFFYITPVENPGIAFGLDFGPQFKLIISIFTILATLGLFVYFVKIKRHNFNHRFAVALILGGAFGNLTDRIFYGMLYGYGSLLSGSVVDFLDLRLFTFFLLNKTFGIYVFNLADVAITIGVSLLIFSLIKDRKTKLKELSEAESTIV